MNTPERPAGLPGAPEAPSEGLPFAHPLLVYDGQCGICSDLAARYELRASGLVEVLAASELRPEHPELSNELLARSVVFVDARREVHEGADAVFRLLHLSGLRWPLWTYRFVPGLAPLAEWAYRRVANNRHRFGSKSCSLPTPAPKRKP